MLAAEDDPAQVLRPRLVAAGADLDRIAVVSEPRRLDRGSDVLALDLDAVRLVVVDPVGAFVTGAPQRPLFDGLAAWRGSWTARSLCYVTFARPAAGRSTPAWAASVRPVPPLWWAGTPTTAYGCSHR